jgi:hypothetical protein
VFAFTRRALCLFAHFQRRHHRVIRNCPGRETGVHYLSPAPVTRCKLNYGRCQSLKKGRALNDFCPDGYLPAQEAILRAAESWSPEQFAALDGDAESETETKPRDNIDAAVRAFSQPQLSDALKEAAIRAVRKLRNLLHQGRLRGYYFRHGGRQSVSRDFWATAEADGTLELGIYWPFGRPTRLYVSRPNYALLFLQSELDALLSEPHPEPKPFPSAKMPDLVAALRSVDDLPNREKQREVLRKLPEFAPYHLTDDVFREAEKQVPRKPGRKKQPPKQ